MTIEVFVGSEPMQVRAERVLEYSIRANTSAAVNVTMMRSGLPGWDDWINPKNPTAFTLFRFAIPELMHFEGVGIYLDCDQLVIGDIAELASYHVAGKWVHHPHREGDAVSVIDCAAVNTLANWPSIAELKSGHLRKWDVRSRLSTIITRQIPSVWNSMDKWEPATRLIHYTDLRTQPWCPDPEIEYLPYPDKEAARLWFAWEAAMKEFEALDVTDRNVMCRPAT